MSSDAQDRRAMPVASRLAFLVGRDSEGRWLAVETHGLGGGLFATKDAAMRYVRFETGRRKAAIPLASEPVSLWP